MVNYVVDPWLVTPLVPAETEVDFENGETFLSVVGFLFLDTRLLGLPIPLHRDFEEVNLRFYVRRKSADTWRRGVVFIRELVPRRAIALVARTAELSVSSAIAAAQTAKSRRADNNRSRSAYRSEASLATRVSSRSFFRSRALPVVRV